MSELLERIQSRGYWEVAIHPNSFVENRLGNISDIFPLVQRHSVQLRGWDFPHIDLRSGPLIGADWAGQDCDWNEYIESCRMHQSGQFTYLGHTEDDTAAVSSVRHR